MSEGNPSQQKQTNLTRKVILVNSMEKKPTNIIKENNNLMNNQQNTINSQLIKQLPQMQPTILQMQQQQLQQDFFKQQQQIFSQQNQTSQNPLRIFDQQQQMRNVNQPMFDKNTNYFTEFWKVCLKNEFLMQQMREYSSEIQELKEKANRIEEMVLRIEKGESQSESKQQKKKRRTAHQISKDFECPYEECKKNYGSEVSLNLHIKIKHNGGNKTEREKLARSIFLAQVNGEELPQVTLNLPPGFMEQQFKENNSSSKKKAGDRDSNQNNDESSNQKNISKQEENDYKSVDNQITSEQLNN